MAPLFSKVDLNKLWHDVQNEETLIFAKFGKDLFNISKVVKKWPSFFDSHVHLTDKLSKQTNIKWPMGNRM